jgi:hypothetical protein
MNKNRISICLIDETYEMDKSYYNIKGHRHREDGPAIEYINGNKYWYSNNLHHREDGPACKYSNGDKSYYLNNVYCIRINFYYLIKRNELYDTNI